MLLSRILVEDREAKVTEQGLLNADVKKDGKRDPDDCSKILRYIAKIIKAEDLGTPD